MGKLGSRRAARGCCLQGFPWRQGRQASKACWVAARWPCTACTAGVICTVRHAAGRWPPVPCWRQRPHQRRSLDSPVAQQQQLGPLVGRHDGVHLQGGLGWRVVVGDGGQRWGWGVMGSTSAAGGDGLHPRTGSHLSKGAHGMEQIRGVPQLRIRSNIRGSVRGACARLADIAPVTAPPLSAVQRGTWASPYTRQQRRMRRVKHSAGRPSSARSRNSTLWLHAALILSAHNSSHGTSAAEWRHTQRSAAGAAVTAQRTQQLFLAGHAEVAARSGRRAARVSSLAKEGADVCLGPAHIGSHPSNRHSAHTGGGRRAGCRWAA